MMWTYFLKVLFMMIALAAYNLRPQKPSPRYWQMGKWDSLAQVARHKTDSTLGVDVYLKDLQQLTEELK